jgi:hypothetical protein
MGIIHFEFVPERTTVNQAFYVEVLKRLTDATRHQQGVVERSLIVSSSRHALAHSLLQVLLFLARKGISAMDNLLYSPNLAPADFWLFPKLKVC